MPAARTRRWHAGTLTYSGAGLCALFVWLLWGDFSFWLKERAVPPTMQLLLHHFHASDFLIAVLLADLPTLLVVLIGPVIAYRSDRHRGRWGRRIPFLLVPTPIAFIAMAGLAFSPAIGREIHRVLGHWSPGENADVIASFAVSFTLFELCSITCNSVFISLINDVVPREMISRFFALFRAVSLIAGMVFNYYFFGQIERHYVPIFLGIGAIYCVGFTAMCLKVKEGAYPPPPAADPAASPGAGSLARRFAAGVKTYCRDCFSLPYYRWVFLLFALSTVSVLPSVLFTILYAKSLGIAMGTFGKYAALQGLLSLLQAYPVGWLADRFHPLRVATAAIFVLTASMLASFLLVHDQRSLGIAYVAVGALSGLWGTATAALPAMLFPQAKFAVFNSAQIMGVYLAQMLVGPACGWALDQLHHQYRYIYLFGTLLGAPACLVTVVVYRKFAARGGAKNYVAPE